MCWSFGGALPAPAVSQESGAQGPVQMAPKYLQRWRCHSSLPFPYGPFLHCSQCSSSYPYLFNMHFHYTTLNVHRSSLLLRATSKSCTEIHPLIKDVSLHLADTVVFLHPGKQLSVHIPQWHYNDSNSPQGTSRYTQHSYNLQKSGKGTTDLSFLR